MGLGRVFLSHYRRHPAQLFGLLLILICAATLWSGVRSLTGSAETAVAKSQSALVPLVSVLRQDGAPLTVEDFAQLRRAGLCVSPRLEVRFLGRDVPSVTGVDPFTAGCLRPEASFSGEDQDEGSDAESRLIAMLDRPLLLGSASDLAQWRQASIPGTQALEFEEVDGIPRGQLLADISVATELGASGRSSLQLLLRAEEAGGAGLPALPNGYRSELQDYGVQPAPLVDGFLLSLDALGALALLVAALLVRSVYRFALEQRRRSLEILVRIGVPTGKLRLALVLEIIAIAAIGGALGVWLGEQLAQSMAAGFQGTLSGLFNIDTFAKSAPTTQTWLGMVLILALVVGWACMDLLMLGRESLAGDHSLADQSGRSQAVRWHWLGALGLVAVSLSILLATEKLWVVFTAASGCLLGVGLLLPELLNRLFACLEPFCRRSSLEWSVSEMRALCNLLSLPLTALAFAIATAIGVQAMVSGFESTFARWLDQRLQGDLYLDPGEPVSTDDWNTRLQTLPGVNAVLPMVRGRALLEQGTDEALAVDVLAIDPTSPLLQDWPFKAAVEDLWSALPNSGVLINEQLARRQSLVLGDRIRFQIGDAEHLRSVLGIYADYGRPEGELMLPLALVGDSTPGRYTAFVLGVSDIQNVPWEDWPTQFPWMAASRLRDQVGLKQAANAAFARTFQMTQLLNGLTLALAGTALALMGIVIFRMRQSSYTLLHVYGVGQKNLRLRLLAHSMLVTGLLGLLAIPLGVFLAWVLVARVNPAAFGWALPLYLYPGFWVQIWLACLGIGALIGVLVGNPVRLETLKNE
ncbi:FtsX-like permease family protein [uncultured Microbulbifer sp.]|uniref:FtsX-like permease family protein n=1 Tax=uncultured Microbulbifer sp. TaxID=348147 RepID=UPI00261FD716|nr:ABC transporter permease [uncultured Microbulbifer sp.]